MLVTFECGCVGLIGALDDPIVIYPCDLDDPECWEPLGLSTRPSLASKGHKPLEPEKVAELIRNLNRLIREGYRFRKIRNLLA